MRIDKRSLALGSLALLGLVSLPSFWEHYTWFITGQVHDIVVQQQWDLVLLHVAVFLAFLIPLHYRRKTDWTSMGMYTAFIVSLFIEMYGIPLSLYLSSSFIGPGPSELPNYIVQFELLGQGLGLTPWMLVGVLVTLIGMVLVAIGWGTLYRTDRDLVTAGIYQYSRHPQYLGIILIALGWFIGWPSLLTTAMLPIVIYTYYRLSSKEEQEVRESISDPEAYDEYIENTPRFI